jgi:hypothetical protein
MHAHGAAWPGHPCKATFSEARGNKLVSLEVKAVPSC